MEADENERREKLRSALWFSLASLITEECNLISDKTASSAAGISSANPTSATPQFIGSLTEMVYTQIQNVAEDLASFATHAGRSIVRTDDVLLLCRRNEALGELVRDFVDEQKSKTGDKSSANRGGRGATSGSLADGKGKSKGKAGKS